MNKHNPVLLVGDVGGTHARFALANPNRVGFFQASCFNCADYVDVGQAIQHYLSMLGVQYVTAICLAVAGPIKAGQVQMTNNGWCINVAQLAKQFADVPVKLINDFAAVARSIPYLLPDEYHPIGEGFGLLTNADNVTLSVIGSGTGLGVAGFIKRDKQGFILPSEAGHTSFAPETALQIELLAKLRERFPRVSNERLLSGAGLENIHWALSCLKKESYVPVSAAEIFAQAKQTDANLAYGSVQLFYEILGQVAGDLALVLQAKEGVFIAGGITKRYPELLVQSCFRKAFENKGRYRGMLEKIPTYLVAHEYPGLLGAGIELNGLDG